MRWSQGPRLIVACLLVVAALPRVAHAGQTVPVLVDRDLTVAAGATLSRAAGEIVERLEDRIVPGAILEERGVPRRSINIGYRTLKLFLFDRPQEEWLMVANHELFGHGGRVRELFDGFVQYRLDPPAPYGRGGGVTYYELSRDFGLHDLQSISVAGMEVNAVTAELIARDAFRRARLSSRTALRYLIMELDGFDYIQKTDDELARPGHDVSDFIRTYNILAEASDASPLTARSLRRRSFATWANPMLASALFGVGRYLVTGKADGPVFALPVGSARVMPAVRYRLAPYGPEWSVTTDVDWNGRLGQVLFRSGRAPGTSPFGIGLATAGIAAGAWTIDVSLDGWRQPPLAAGPDANLDLLEVAGVLQWGGRVGARAETDFVPLWRGTPPVALIVDAAYKSRGFMPGEPLGEGLVLRAGFGLRLGPP